MVKDFAGEDGVSAIGAVLAVLIFSLLMAVVVSVVTISASTGLQEELGVKAFYISEGGLQFALKNGTPPCSYDVAAPVPLGGGSFVVDATCMATWAGCSAPATLAAPIADTDTAITVDTTAGYEIPGTILLETEYVFCKAASVNQFSQCDRGVEGSTTAPHALGVQAMQCTVTSKGTYATGLFMGDVNRTVRANVGE